MHKTTYSIRTGFEFQDLYCARELLRMVEAREHNARFAIESDDVDFVDDLVIKPQRGKSLGAQIKFHVNQGYNDSFESFTNVKTATSKSQLQKLYKGWRDLTGHEASPADIVFVSSNNATSKSNDLGTAIDSATRKINPALFSRPEYDAAWSSWAKNLGTTRVQLQEFLAHVTFRFASESLQDLRDRCSEHLGRLRLPDDLDALAVLLEIVGKYATEHHGEETISDFIRDLAKRPTFREACEQRFGEIISANKTAATQIRIAVVSLECLPAYVGRECACLEEPFPLRDYRSSGLTRPTLAGVFAEFQDAWYHEYLEWHQNRIREILTQLVGQRIDLLIFPRFAIPFDVASEVYTWCKEQKCTAIVGGHSLIPTADAPSRYREELNLRIDELPTPPSLEELTEFVVDSALRFDRVGRYSISGCNSPFASREVLLSQPELFQVLTDSGWVSTVLVPSIPVLDALTRNSPPAPNLIIVSTAVAGNAIRNRIDNIDHLHGTPVIVAGLDMQDRPYAYLAGDQSVIPTGDAWEGIVILQVAYSRPAPERWNASLKPQLTIPIVYTQNGAVPDSKTLGTMHGKAASVNQARSAAADVKPAINRITCLSTEDPDSFFARRARDSERLVRSRIGLLPPNQIHEVTAWLEANSQFLIDRPYSRTPDAHATQEQERNPVFVDRGTEIKTISKFVERDSPETVMVLYGAPGIGKRTLLADIQRKDSTRENWLRFRCIPDSPFPEQLAHLSTLLGTTTDSPRPLDVETYGHICEALIKASPSVLVIEDSHHLPIARGIANHSDFLSFLATLCRYEGSNVPRVVFVSDRHGELQFSGRHRLVELPIRGLDLDYMIQLLRELVAQRPSKYTKPTAREFEQIAERLQNHPKLAEIAASLLEETSADELMRTLHTRNEVRQFVLNRLLGRTSLSKIERQILQVAATHRIPVDYDAFAKVAGAQSRVLIKDLNSRFLLSIVSGKLQLHPLLADHFSADPDTGEQRQLHRIAFEYFERLRSRRRLSLDEMTEFVFHAVRAGASLELKDLRIFTGPLRTSLFEALRERTWDQVIRDADRILEVFEADATARVAKAVALDATGRPREAEEFVDSILELDQRSLWIALELARSRIRRRDLNSAERILTELEQRFGLDGRIQVAWAHLLEARGRTEEAVERCKLVLENPGRYFRDAFYAALVLRHANRLDVLTTAVEEHWSEAPTFPPLFRLFAFACVVTGHSPEDGLRDLSEMWQLNPRDGRVVADYALALSRVGRTKDAEKLFKDGLRVCSHSRDGRGAVLEEYASFLSDRERFTEAHEVYRELLRYRQYDLHIYRRFARSLLGAAAVAKNQGNHATEDVCRDEAQQVLAKLLEIAPEDAWAQAQAYKAQGRNYSV